MAEIDEMSPLAKAMLYTICTCEELKAQGFIEGGSVEIQPKGWEAFEALKASGYKPTDDEINRCMRHLCRREA